MMNTIKLKIFLSLVIISINSYAATCPLELFPSDNNAIISVQGNSLKYDYSKTSREIRSLPSNVNMHQNSKLLGLFSSKKRYSIQPEFLTYGTPQIGYCISLKKITVTIETQPTIFISREAQQFSCTKHRTEQHELLHYKFDSQGLDMYTKQINNQMKGLFNKHFYFNSKEEISLFFKQMSDHYFSEESKAMNSYAQPFHEQLDSEENYKRESSYCSYNENYRLHELLRNNY